MVFNLQLTFTAGAKLHTNPERQPQCFLLAETTDASLESLHTHSFSLQYQQKTWNCWDKITVPGFNSKGEVVTLRDVCDHIQREHDLVPQMLLFGTATLYDKEAEIKEQQPPFRLNICSVWASACPVLLAGEQPTVQLCLGSRSAEGSSGVRDREAMATPSQGPSKYSLGPVSAAAAKPLMSRPFHAGLTELIRKITGKPIPKECRLLILPMVCENEESNDELPPVHLHYGEKLT
ncbi:hypothetical protein L345_09050, partial [Ophiophagus hannah]